jgi:putative sigma-54 modulation protein
MIAVQVFGREMKVEDSLRDYINKRASKLDRFMETIDEARVDLIYRKGARAATERYKAQITLRGHGFALRSEERGDQAQTAFDEALERIERQIERYKGKHSLGKRDTAPISEAADELLQADEEEPVGAIARRKKFLLHPMDVSEAIEEMSLLGHENFFVFYNMDAAGVSVLYRRGDGSYGLIDTELA